MKEITIVRYEAEDGKRFDTQEECLTHEKDIIDSKKIMQKFNDIMDFCHEHCDEIYDDYEGYNVCDNNECPFYDSRCGHNCTFMCLPYIDFTKFTI